MRGSRNSRQRGASLVEVTLALGLMAGMLATMAGLFVIGAGQVKKGRASSEALVAARTVIEEIEGWSFHDTYLKLELTGDTDSLLVRTDTYDQLLANKWQSMLGGSLEDARAEISLVTLDPGAPDLELSSQMRVTVTIFWMDGNRRRSIALALVRI